MIEAYGWHVDMVPDPSIVRRVRRAYPWARIEWNRWRCRWEVYDDDPQYTGAPTHLFTVENEDQSYRPLDPRVVDRVERAACLMRQWRDQMVYHDHEQREYEALKARREASAEDDRVHALDGIWNHFRNALHYTNYFDPRGSEGGIRAVDYPG